MKANANLLLELADIFEQRGDVPMTRLTRNAGRSILDDIEKLAKEAGCGQ